MSIVPILALAFWIAEAFGLYEKFRDEIIAHFPEQKEAFESLFEFATNLLAQIEGGILASLGFILLCFTVVFLFSNMEMTLNHIWDVKRLKKWWRMIIDYLALMIFTPLFFVFASTFLIERLKTVIRALPIGGAAISGSIFSVNLLSYCFFWALFAFLYFFIPNTKVRFRSALIAGILAGTLYLIFQWAYIYFQVIVARYGSIYGSMAAIPLFLIWVKLSWSIFLFGAELSHAHQNKGKHVSDSI